MTPPKPLSCATPEPAPMSVVARGEKGGAVLLDFTVDSSGATKDWSVDPLSGTQDPALISAARDWVKNCRYQPGTLQGSATDIRTSRAIGFASDYEIDRSAAPLDWSDAAARALTPPRLLSCLPQDPVFLDSVDDSRFSVVVQRDGHAGDVRVAEHLGEEPSPALELTRLWLRTCKFEPARDAKGNPVAVRTPLPALFGDTNQPPPRAALPFADGKSLPIPEPTTDCDLHPWLNAPAGAALPPLDVEYVVDPEGRASEITLLSPAHREVFHAVRRYLLGCRFMPIHDVNGDAQTVRAHRSFYLRLGTRRLAPKGPETQVIEGKQP